MYNYDFIQDLGGRFFIEKKTMIMILKSLKASNRNYITLLPVIKRYKHKLLVLYIF